MKHTIDGVRSYLALRERALVMNVPARDEALEMGLALVTEAARIRATDPAVARMHLARAIDYWADLAEGQYHQDARRLARLIAAGWGEE